MGSKTCPRCGGQGWFGSRFGYGDDSHDRTCRHCDGSGEDPYWGEKSCAHCGDSFDYRYEWSNVPDYCKECNQWLTTGCEGCQTDIRYKVYWANPPKFCDECKKWHSKRCQGCGGDIQYKSYWDNVPDYCKDCKEWKAKPCLSCGSDIRYKSYWEHVPNICSDCKKAGQGRRDHRHESNQSENERFHNACKHAGLDDDQIYVFSFEFHSTPNRERMKFEEIVAMARDWAR